MSQSPYAQVGPRLVQLGYSAIPIQKGQKKPGIYWRGAGWKNLEGWNRYGQNLPSAQEVEKWCTWPDANVGIVLGSLSGILGVDFDYHEELWDPIFEFLPESPVIKRGQKGFTAFYRYSGEETTSWKKDGEMIVELLAAGKQTVIPPSIHTCGLAYRWEEAGLIDVPREQLPTLPPDFISRVDAILSPAKEPSLIIEMSHEFNDAPPSLEMMRVMLGFIDPAEVYDDWIATGMSLHSLYPGSDGATLFEEHSARAAGQKRKDGRLIYQPGCALKSWQTFKQGGGRTYKTICKKAKDRGFIGWRLDDDLAVAHVSPVLEPYVEVVEEYSPDPEPESLEEQKHELKHVYPQMLLDATPGVVGEIANWITKGAHKPQPILSLGASLAFVGAMKGRRQRTRTDLRSNIYVLALGETGSGKNHPIAALQHLNLCVFGEGIDRGILTNRPRSEQGLYSAIGKHDCRSLILWDEIGQAICAMANKNASAHYAAIMDAFTQLFSAADRIHSGEELATLSRPSLEQPCLCLYGTTVADRFFEALTEKEVIDGFLARWLVFEAPDPWVKENDDAWLADPPDSIRQAMLKINDKPLIPLAKSHPGTLVGRVFYDEGGERYYRDLRAEFSKRGQDAHKDGDKRAPVWVRAAEHVAKVALIVTDGDRTTRRELEWAHRLIEIQCENMIHIIDTRMAENRQERNTKRILKLIADGRRKGISRSAITNKTLDLNKLERDGILETLVDSGRIEKIKPPEGKESKGRRAEIYRCRK